MKKHRDRRRSLALLAALCALVLPHIPLLSYLCLPLELMVTAVHEMSHALAALLTGGHVVSIDIYADGSGVTLTQGGIAVVTASAGYLGSTLFGCLLLVAAQRERWHKATLGVLFVYFAAFTFFARNVVAIVIGLGVLAGLWAAGRSRISAELRFFILDFIAISSCLYAFHDFVTLMLIASGVARATNPLGTDANILAATTGLPPLCWAVGWGLLSAVAAVLCIRKAWRMTETRPAA